MKNILLKVLMLIVLVASIAGRVQAKGVSDFVGLWEAIDPEDGSHQVLSITNNDDGTVKLLIYDTYFSSCNGGRGLVQVTGKVSAEQSLTVDEFVVTCFTTSKTETLSATFTRNSDGTLTWDRSAEPAPPPPSIIFHKTSN